VLLVEKTRQPGSSPSRQGEAVNDSSFKSFNAFIADDSPTGATPLAADSSSALDGKKRQSAIGGCVAPNCRTA